MAVYFGADYYPEHWAEERWETDGKLMRDLGLHVVRMGEFSWAKMEPAAGEFHFDWLDRAIERLAGYGVKTLLGTPTAAPPAWIIERNPEILPMDSEGQRKGFGGRHHDCQSNPVYRGHINRLVTAMATHFRDNPHVIGWQIDNELGNSHEDLCYCDSCQAAFQEWLRKKYGTIEKVNEEWGTAFWSQDYDKFSQIPAPRRVPTVHNPSLLLDWKRFCSDLVVDFHRFQVRIIKGIAPHQKVTHNLMGLYDKTDYFALAADLDFAANDQYPTGYYFDPPGQSPAEISACLDFIRSVKKKNFWMMELQAGATGGGLIGRNPRPGQLRLWTEHCIAHGADTVVYFRWRTCLFGTEQFWHGILPHDGVPGRRYEEIKATIREMVPVLQDIEGIVTKAEVAIVFSYEQNFALKIQPQHPELDYIEQVKLYYESFYVRNIAVDFISENEDMTGYRLVIAPLQYLMEAEREERFKRFVAAGGRLVFTMRTGVKNLNNVCMSEMPLPGRLHELLGLRVAEYDCPLGLTVALEWQEPFRTGTANKWCDILQLEGATPLACYKSEYYRETPAITVNQYEKGRAFYVGTEPSREILQELAGYLARECGLVTGAEYRGHGGGENNLIRDCGLAARGGSSAAVELTVRKGRERDYLFALNHTDEVQQVTVGAEWTLLTGSGLPTEGSDDKWIEGYGVHIFYQNKEQEK